MAEPVAPGEVNTPTSQTPANSAPPSPSASPKPVTGPTDGGAAVAVDVPGAGAGAGAVAGAMLQDVTASERNGTGDGAGAGGADGGVAVDVGAGAGDDIVPLEPMAPPQLPGANEEMDLVASTMVDTELDGDESEDAGDAAGAAQATPGQPGPAPGKARPTSLAERTMSRRNLVIQQATHTGGEGGALKPEDEAELAQEAAQAANAAAVEAENAMAIADAAQVTEMNAEELQDALADDGLSGAAPELQEFKDADGNVQSVRAVVPLTKTKHTLSFRFLGREMLEGKTFEDPDLARVRAVCCVPCCVERAAGASRACGAHNGSRGRGVRLTTQHPRCWCSCSLRLPGKGALPEPDLHARARLHVRTRQGHGQAGRWSEPVP